MSRKRPVCWIIFLSVAALILLTGFVAGGLPTYFHYHKGVVVWRLATARSLLSPHHEPRTVLRFGRAEFQGLKGGAPYFVDLPDIHSILFITEKDSIETVFVLNLTTGEVVRFEGTGIQLASRLNTDFVKVSIVKGEAHQGISIVESGLNYQNAYELDLENKIIRKK